MKRNPDGVQPVLGYLDQASEGSLPGTCFELNSAIRRLAWKFAAANRCRLQSPPKHTGHLGWPSGSPTILGNLKSTDLAGSQTWNPWAIREI